MEVPAHMSVFCTYCSKSKSSDPGTIPAICRYNSERIRRVYAAACSLNLRFFILSGKFGLIEPQHCIPDYDHLLRSDEVSAFADRVIRQINEHGIDGFVYFTKPLASNPDLLRYHDALVAACRSSSRAFFVVELEDSNI